MAGVPDGVHVDLTLVRLPPTSLIFPAAPEAGEDFDFAKPRTPRAFSNRLRVAQIGWVRFHDLQVSHATVLLDANIPIHTVAQRLVDDPAVLLRNYAKRKRSKKAVASAITAIAAGFLK